MLKLRWPLLIIVFLLCLPQVREVAAEYAGLPLIRDLSETISDDQIWAINQDRQGIMYFGTNSNLLEYDGADLLTVSLSNQSAARSIAIHSSGEIFVGGMGEVGMIRRDPTGSLIYRKFEDSAGQF